MLLPLLSHPNQTYAGLRVMLAVVEVMLAVAKATQVTTPAVVAPRFPTTRHRAMALPPIQNLKALPGGQAPSPSGKDMAGNGANPNGNPNLPPVQGNLNQGGNPNG